MEPSFSGVSVGPQMKMKPIQKYEGLYSGQLNDDSYFCEGEFLQNRQVREARGECLSSRGEAAGIEGSHRSLEEECLDLAAPRFPVTSLKHVTTGDYFRLIVKEGAIRGCDRYFILKGKPVTLGVSCWSPHIPRSEMESFKSRRFEECMQRYDRISPTDPQFDPALLEVREMLANSPALRDDSRYGNFQFTQRLEDLLRSYKEQHCGGQEPALRVLGTEAYKLEVVHWVLIHSPSQTYFDHLPLLDSVWPPSATGDRIWAPESTTDLYTWFIDPPTGHLFKYPQDLNPGKMYDPSRWNNLVYAFDLTLSGGPTLSLGRGPLLDSVEACEMAKSLWGDSSRVLRHPLYKYVSKEEAESVIREERVKASSAGQ